MNYHQISVASLSPNQLSRFKNGHPITVKRGNGLQIPVSAEQHKKITKAHQKGKGIRIQADPFIQHHLKGGSIQSIIKKGVAGARRVANKIAPVARKIVQNPVVRRQIDYAIDKYAPQVEQYAEHAIAPYVGEQIAHEAVQSSSRIAKRNLKRKLDGGKIKLPKVNWKKVGNTLKSGLEKVGSVLRPVARPILHTLADTVVPAALDAAAVATGNPGIALMGPAATLAANKGIDALGNKYGFGMAKKRGRGRPKSHKGSALFPSGM